MNEQISNYSNGNKFKFLRMSVYYFERRVEKNTWNYFVDDLEEKLQLSETLDVLKI